MCKSRPKLAKLPARECRRIFSPRVELCEDRLLLALFTVTSAADDGSAGTLRDTILQLDQSNDPTNTIAFAIASGAQEIALTSPFPPVTAQVNLDGTSQPG